MHCAFVLRDIVRDKSTPHPRLVHAGVGVAWANRGHRVGKVRTWVRKTNEFQKNVSYWNSFTPFRLSCKELYRFYNYTDWTLLFKEPSLQECLIEPLLLPLWNLDSTSMAPRISRTIEEDPRRHWGGNEEDLGRMCEIRWLCRTKIALHFFGTGFFTCIPELE